MKTFVLNYYDDLFKKKNKNSLRSRFTLFIIFFLNYNYDIRLISFYNNDIENMQNNKKNEGKTNISKLLVIIWFIIFIIILGFFIGRKYILMIKKQK